VCNRDDDIACFVALFNVAVRFDDLLHWVAPFDDGLNLSSFDDFLDVVQVFCALIFVAAAAFHNRGVDAVGGKRFPALGFCGFADGIKDEVILFPVLVEVLFVSISLILFGFIH